MEWFILSRDLHVLCVPSTDSPNSLPIFDDKQTILLSNNTVVSTYDFSVQQKHPDVVNLKYGNYVVFKDKYAKTRMYTLISHDGDDLTQTWHAEDIGLDLLNETADKWDYTGQSHGIDWYFNELVLKDTGWTIGVNEISSLNRGLKFEGQADTQLKRLGDIANQFDGAEIDFEVQMSGSNVTKQVINIYKKVGTSMTQQRFVDSVNLKSLQSSGSIADLCTAMIGYGSQPDIKDGENAEDVPPIDFTDLSYDDGQFFSPKGDKAVYDRLNHLVWSRHSGFDESNQNETKGYITGIYTYETKDPNELLNRTITELKKRNAPSETYEANLLDINADIGDQVQIAHNNYNPPIYLSSRVESVTNCYTANGQDTGILGDYQKLESQIDPRIKEMIDQLADQIKPNYTWLRYAKDDKGTGMTSRPTSDTKYVAILVNKPTAIPSDNPEDYAGHWQLIQGQDGAEGIPGPKGEDGKTSYTHFAYADNVSGTKDFSVDDPTGRSYMGVYSDFTKADSTNPSDYVWSYTKGETGPEGMRGAQGIPGKPGADGKTPYTHVAYADNDEGGGFSQSPDNKAYMGWYTDYTETDSTDVTKYAWSLIKGADGKDGADGVAGKDGVGVKATAITYTQSTSGTTPPTASWTASVPTLIKGQFLWTRTVWTYSDSTTETGYTVSYNAKDGNTGSDGRAGKDGVGIKSTAITYASSTSGTSAPTSGWVSTPPSATAGQFIWTRTIWTYTDNTTETGYSVGKIGEKGATGSTGANGAPGKPGADGKTPYFHQAWADSKDGKANFSTTDPTNRGYLGTYSDFTQADSNDPSKYFWVELVGAIEIGGRNLVSGTDKEYTMGFGIPTTSWKDGYAYLKLPINTTTGEILPQDPHTFHYTLIQGTTYTQTVWFETDATVKDLSASQITWFTGAGHDYQPARVQKLGQNSYKVVSTYTWPGKSDNNNNVRLFDTGNLGSAFDLNTGTYLKFGKLKLEIGNKATDWTPAPEDTQQQIDTINKGLSDTNSKIAAVTKVDSQSTAPTNPKKGDQWWVKDADGNINAFKIWDGTKWADSIIQQSAMNISTLNGNTINGAVINGSKFTSNFSQEHTEDYKTGPLFEGVQTIGNGMYTVEYKVKDTKAQHGYTHIRPDGIVSYITDENGDMQAYGSLTQGGFNLTNKNASGYLYPEDLVRVGPEEWSNNDGSTKFTIRLELRWGRVWLSGVLLLPAAKFGTGGNGYRTIFNIKNTNLIPASTRWVKCSSFGDVPHSGLLEFRPNGDVVAIGIPSQGRYSFEGESYTIESL